MLSEQSKPLIDASVPVLREHGLTITQTFYRNMFASHPELTNLFNMGNQANGSQQQSLAAAVFAYAANHGNNAALAPVVGRIVHKHAAVGIRPSHYPIVARHLLGAIAEVLGDAATPELLAAWDEAYWLLAAELIAAEARLYAHTQSGPDHRQPVRIIERHPQAEDVVSLTLEAIGEATLADFLPGQYISVQVELAPGVLQQRQYSLSDAPNGRTWRISVKRDAGGTVSNWLHDNVRPGAVLLVSQPYGDFVPQLATDNPIVLMSAGVGITPMIATLNTLARRSTARKVVFSHAGRTASHVAHADDLERAAQALPDFEAHVFLESGEAAAFASRPARPGRMTVDTFLGSEVADADFYLCGPLPFMQAQRAALLASGVPAARIHREVFGPDLLDDIL
ncbi:MULTISPECIES: globin domain-containing protein [Ralstonia solanacearum species complex]|uniref:nitric oxide dioxygenase n=1 Tax=Ralstonia syzygii TaxID=28097 RepID=A0ABX7ZA28_9RALS|nr:MULTISPECIES: globin domain-containing protein [Ralstonia solanacearum species complex]BEU70482.1 NO-inducible flavohemoprotein [Ralstonia pseudosolanacearum]AXV75534.1 flavohemoprotein [Ralstonia solanacearum]AXV89536.1 flavohemoprotein [Ralstonia solanacearum]AXW17744.1 flavohemoprotein [Ralstonia solanacearum]AXW60615.1 flavohemoprotein [Ralstonia solanacearum]